MNKLNYQQSATECHDKLVELCNKWEMCDSKGFTMRLNVDDEFMATIYSTVRLLNKIRGIDEELNKQEEQELD